MVEKPVRSRGGRIDKEKTKILTVYFKSRGPLNWSRKVDIFKRPNTPKYAI
jgi:hypothetical protein